MSVFELDNTSIKYYKITTETYLAFTLSLQSREVKILTLNDHVDENLNRDIVQFSCEDIGYLKFDKLVNIGGYCAIIVKTDSGNSTSPMDKETSVVYSRQRCRNRIFSWLCWISSFISGSRVGNNSL
jgi:hypothetical protein